MSTSKVTGGKISFVSSGPQLGLPAQPSGRNWLPLAIAVAVVAIAGAALFVVFSRGGKSSSKVTPANASLAPYAANLKISGVAMSRSSNFIGTEITYLEGHITNTGSHAVTGITVQVLFRDYTNIVTQNTTESMQFIRTRVPYIDVEPVSAAPLQPGKSQDFRLVFDGVSPNWNGEYPEIRLIEVETR